MNASKFRLFRSRCDADASHLVKEQSKILLVKLGSIGDVVNTLPLANALKNAFPETTLAWLIFTGTLAPV